MEEIPKPGLVVKSIIRIVQFGAVFLFLSTSYKIIGNIYILKVGQETKGKIVSSYSVQVSSGSSNRFRSSSISSYIYKPIIQYNVNGEIHEVHGEIVGSMDTNYQMEEAIDLLYLPDNPDFVVIHNFMEMWLMPILKLGLAAVLFVFASGLPWILAIINNLRKTF